MSERSKGEKREHEKNEIERVERQRAETSLSLELQFLSCTHMSIEHDLAPSDETQQGQYLRLHLKSDV